MNTLFKELLRKGDPIATSGDIYHLFPHLNANAVQAKIKRCLKSGELKRLYKGVYSLNSEYLKKPVFEEKVAQAIDDSAFLSGLGALRYHNLIPEIVNYKTFFGRKSAKVNQKHIRFEIKKIPLDQINFGVESVSVAGTRMRIADPVRAIMDALIEQNLSPKNRYQICSYFRIDEDEAESIHWEKASLYAFKFRNNRLAKEIANAMMNNNVGN